MLLADDLKKSILQYAIQGKLVPQDANDEPAEILYAKIQAEKQKLIKEGKIKKEKPLPPITDDEIPFEIPSTWKWVRLGEVFAHNTGKALNSSKQEGKLKRYITTSNVYWNYFKLDEIREMRFNDDELQKCTVKKGDLLVCEGGDFGRAAIWNYDYDICIQNHIHRLNAYLTVCTMFFYYMFFLYKMSGYIGGKGIGIQGLSSGALHNIVIPFPPLAEQKRIVAKIEELEPLIKQYGEDETELSALNTAFPEQLKKSILQYAIQGKLVPQDANDESAEVLYTKIQAEKQKLIKEGKIKKDKPLPPITDEEIPFDIPPSWKWVKLREIVFYYMGKTPPRKEPVYWDKASYPWVSISDLIADGSITETKEKINDYSCKNVFKEKISKAGTLLMSFKLTIGRVSILNIDAFHNEAIISIYPIISHQNITRNYLFKLLPFLTTFGKTKSAIKGETLNSDSIDNLLIPLPPLAEQKRIVEKLDKLLPMIDNLTVG